MFRFLVLATLLAVAAGHWDITEKWANKKSLEYCLGKDNYKNWTDKIKAAKKACYVAPLTPKEAWGNTPSEAKTAAGSVNASVAEPNAKPAAASEAKPSAASGVKPLPKPTKPETPVRAADQRRSEEAAAAASSASAGEEPKEFFMTAEKLKKIGAGIHAKASNFTCVAHKLGIVDAEFTLTIDTARVDIQRVLPNNEYLAKNLVKVMTYCENAANTMTPLLPMPEKLQRIMKFFKCYKKLRAAVCMKADIMENYLDEFEFAGTPMENLPKEEQVSKIFTLMWAKDAESEFMIN